MSRIWTDAEVLAHTFRIAGRPDALEGLMLERPALDGLRFMQDYNITPPVDLADRHGAEPFVLCALCQKARHWIGWLAENDAGQRFLVGSNCAARHGAPELRLAQRAFDVLVRRQEQLRRRDRYITSLPAVVLALREWADAPAIRQADEWASDFGNAFARLEAALLSKAKSSAPVLTRTVSVRDYAAEERRPEIPGKKAKPIYIEQERVTATLPTYLPLGERSPDVRIQNLADRLEKINGRLRHANSDPAALKDAFEDVSSALHGLSVLRAALAKLHGWNDPGIWRAVVAWWTGLEGWDCLRITDRVLEGASHGERWVAVELPTFAPIEPPVALDLALAELQGPPPVTREN